MASCGGVMLQPAANTEALVSRAKSRHAATNINFKVKALE